MIAQALNTLQVLQKYTEARKRIGFLACCCHNMFSLDFGIRVSFILRGADIWGRVFQVKRVVWENSGETALLPIVVHGSKPKLTFIALSLFSLPPPYVQSKVQKVVEPISDIHNGEYKKIQISFQEDVESISCSLFSCFPGTCVLFSVPLT